LSSRRSIFRTATTRQRYRHRVTSWVPFPVPLVSVHACIRTHARETVPSLTDQFSLGVRQARVTKVEPPACLPYWKIPARARTLVIVLAVAAANATRYEPPLWGIVVSRAPLPPLCSPGALAKPEIVALLAPPLYFRRVFSVFQGKRQR
jgi:hypothetical protein